MAAAELDRRTRGGSLVSPKKSAGRPAKRSKTAKGKDVSTADQEAKMMGQELEAVDMEDLNLRRLDLSLLADGVVLKPFQRTGVIWLGELSPIANRPRVFADIMTCSRSGLPGCWRDSRGRNGNVYRAKRWRLRTNACPNLVGIGKGILLHRKSLLGRLLIALRSCADSSDDRPAGSSTRERTPKVQPNHRPQSRSNQLGERIQEVRCSPVLLEVPADDTFSQVRTLSPYLALPRRQDSAQDPPRNTTGSRRGGTGATPSTAATRA